MTPIIRILQILSLGALAALGCASTSTVDEAAPAANATKAPQEVTIQPAVAPSLQPVYFDTDQAVLRADARASLEARAEAIRQHPELGAVTIQGHCDERGSDEYNLSLSEKRAEAVRRALLKFAPGIDAHMRTVAFGEEKPVIEGNGNESFAKNRRVDFHIISLSE